MNILNCNPYNGNEITDTTARISFYGKIDSIDHIYANARRDKNGNIAGIDNLDHLYINGVKFPVTYCGVFYTALWWQFFSENKDIADRIRKLYDDYNDGMPEGIANSAARVFKLLKAYGLNGLYSNCKSFFMELRDKSKDRQGLMEEDTFETLDSQAKMIIRDNYGKMSKEQILDTVKKQPHYDILIRLTDVRYDEYDKACSPDYILHELRKIKAEYESGKKQKYNEIILE